MTNPTNRPTDSQASESKDRVAGKPVAMTGYTVAFTSTVVFAILTGMTSGMPSLVAFGGLIGIGLFLWFHQPVFFYLGFGWLACGSMIPWFRSWMENTFVGDWVHAVTSLGLLIAGLAYMEIVSPLYQVWSGDHDESSDLRQREAQRRSRFEKAARAQPFAGLLIPSLAGVLGGTIVLGLFPLHSIDREVFRMVSPVVRLLVLLLAISLPAWAIYMLMTLVAWRRLTPAQAYLHVLRVFHQEQGAEQRVIEKRLGSARSRQKRQGQR